MNAMLKKLIGLEEGESIVTFEMFFRHGGLLLVLALVAAVAFAVYLYRREEMLAKWRRVVMGFFQALAVLVLVFILVEPAINAHIVKPMKRTVLVLLDTSKSMDIRDIRTREADVEDVARITGITGISNRVSESAAAAVAALKVPKSRLELAQLSLTNSEMKFVEKLAAEHDVRFFSCDQVLRPEAGRDGSAAWLSGRTADGAESRIGSALAEAVERHAGQPLDGVVVLSDFAWTGGRDPAEVAREMKTRGIPVFTVGIGVSAQPDYSLRGIIAPDVAFAGDKIPLRIQVTSAGFDGQAGDLALSVNGEGVTTQKVVFAGGVQFEEIVYKPAQKSGTITLEAAVSGPPGEVSKANNTVSHKIKILDEKINVLYVEGMPRWEYRYLRWVLLRDQRLDVRFLMTEGDPALASTSPRQLAKFPEDPAEIRKYDLVILGDVPAKYFNAAQLDRMEELVREGGGSLLMLAGPVGAPASYTQTAIAKVLPVKFSSDPWRDVREDRYPVVTPEGLESPCTSLLSPAEANAHVWSRVRPLSRLPALDGVKPGATTLLTLSGEIEGTAAYPLVAWQRYGSGKAMFVGSEDLWRLRLEEGTTYHARFWGQTIQFLALSRLLGANKKVYLETDRLVYGTGEQIKIFANVLTDAFKPAAEPSYKVLVEQAGQAQTPLEVELEPVPNSPGLYSGTHLAKEDGTFTLKTLALHKDMSNVVQFDVKTTSLEQRETDMQANVARQMAELSGGRTCRLSELGALPAALHHDEPLTQSIHRERDLWDLPLFFVALVLFTGIEWAMRRRDNLV